MSIINSFNCLLGLIRKIKDFSIDLEKTKKINKNLSKTTRGEWEHKSEEQKNTINQLRMFYKAREKVITLFDDYTAIVCKAKYKAKHGKRLKISTLKQMLQRLLILLHN